MLAPDDGTRITSLLRRAAGGDAGAEHELLQSLYVELRSLARRHMRAERLGHTLQPSALVNEAYLRLLRGKDRHWQDRVHFLATASRVMRNILVDHARRRTTAKRGLGAVALEVDDNRLELATARHPPERIIAVDEALTALGQSEPRRAQIVELRFFAGMTDEEIAGFLRLSLRTVRRDWAVAKAWLYRYLGR